MLWYWRQGSDYYRPARLDATHTVETDYVPDDFVPEQSRVHQGLPTDF